jgi:hypothetical protein
MPRKTPKWIQGAAPKPGALHRQLGYTTEQYEQPIGPPKPTAMQRFESEHQIISGTAHRVKDAAVSGATWMQKRGREIQQEAPRSMPRSPMAGLPRDPFGTSRAGNPFGGSGVPFTAHPFNDRAGPIRNDQNPPRRPAGARGSTIYHPNGDVEVVHARVTTKKRGKRRSRDSDDDNPFGNPMGIPKSMRHLF